MTSREPDAGNPPVRFDEGRSGGMALTSAVSSNQYRHFAYSTVSVVIAVIVLSPLNAMGKILSEHVEVTMLYYSAV